MVTLVLLPGMDGTGDLFEALLRELGAPFAARVVRYPTTEPLNYNALTELARHALPRAGPYVILGESFSGPVAVRLASERPSGLAGLILCASFVANPAGWLRRLEPLLEIAPIGRLARRFGPWKLLGRSRTSEQTGLLRQTLARIPDRVLLTRLHEVMTVDVSAPLAAVEVPILYLQATEDGLVEQRTVDQIVRIAPSTRVARVVGPHCLLQCAPREAAREIQEFALALPASQTPRQT